MGIVRKPTRYAHSDGHTDVCYSEDGTRLITCGTDGDIRIWSGFDDDDPIQTCVGEWALCVCHKGERLYIATDKNDVQAITYPESERDGILVRFTAHVNHIAVGKNHNVIATAAEDMAVKVLDLADQKEPRILATFSDLPGPPLSVALCPNARLVAVSFGDGQLRIWNINNSSLLKEIECVPKTNSFMNAKLLCRIHFEPVSGRALAYPNNNTVIIVDTTSWSTKLILMCPTIEPPFSIVQYSPCGNLMAATSQQGDIVVWEIATKNVIGVVNHPKSISLCAMSWNPSGNGEIAFCDVQGQLGIVVNCVLGNNITEMSTPINGGELDNEVDFSEFKFEDDEDEDNENAVSIEKLKEKIMGTKEPELDFDNESFREPTPRARTPQIPLQSVFMPSSTPEHLNPRYLCWNAVGVVRSFGSDYEEDDKSIEVEFHDTNLHNGIMMQNYQGYTMGCVSTAAFVIANARQMTTIPLNAGDQKWVLNLPEDEEIICIAASDKLVCFATANYLIRVHSIYGTQKAVLSVPGPVVSMSAYSYFLLTAYHSSALRKGDQCINVMLTKLEGMSLENKYINSSLRPETTLKWLGFTDIGTPAMQDSYGFISLFPKLSNIWIPFCDTTKYRKNPGDGFFITAVLESIQSTRGIRCRGSEYPGFIPRPTQSDIPIEPPFLDLVTEKSQMEANIFTWSTLHVENVQKQNKETILKIFALACKNDLNQRALELMEMMADSQLITLATKYATKLNKQRLAEKLIEIASSLQDDDHEDFSFNQSSIATPRSNIELVKRKVGRNSSLNDRYDDQASSSKVKNTDLEHTISSTSEHKQNNVSSMKNISLANTSVTSGELNTTPSERKNPFLKSLKTHESDSYNPLSLTNKFAGAEGEKKKEKENKTVLNSGAAQKRKKPDSETEKPKDYQGRLEHFKFTKRS